MRSDHARIARNEARRRDVNEAIEDGRRQRSGLVGFICECGEVGCTSILELTLAEYESVRADPRRFLVLDGHEHPEVERVVERHERYAVVEKVGEAGAIAEDADPRDGS